MIKRIFIYLLIIGIVLLAVSCTKQPMTTTATTSDIIITTIKEPDSLQDTLLLISLDINYMDELDNDISYYMYDGKEIDIDYTVHEFIKKAKGFDKYDAYINALEDSKYDELKYSWAKVYSNSKDIIAILESVKFERGVTQEEYSVIREIYWQYHNGFYDESIKCGLFDD